MNEEFILVLPSNSSMDFYPQNKTTHYTTYLPRHIVLQGNWSVALTEIQVPLTFQHIGSSLEERTGKLHRIPWPDIENNVIAMDSPQTDEFHISPGKYSDVDSLLEEINSSSSLREHIKLQRTSGGRVCIRRKCLQEKSCKNMIHAISLPENLRKIMGFTQPLNGQKIPINDEAPTISENPATLSNGLPRGLMIYADILEPYPTGDVKTKLLRAVPLELENYNYGSVFMKNFSPPTYVPLLYTSFRTIEIDIRDQFGDVIPFDGGTLMTTLHFKKSL